MEASGRLAESQMKESGWSEERAPPEREEEKEPHEIDKRFNRMSGGGQADAQSRQDQSELLGRVNKIRTNIASTRCSPDWIVEYSPTKAASSTTTTPKPGRGTSALLYSIGKITLPIKNHSVDQGEYWQGAYEHYRQDARHGDSYGIHLTQEGKPPKNPVNGDNEPLAGT